MDKSQQGEVKRGKGRAVRINRVATSQELGTIAGLSSLHISGRKAETSSSACSDTCPETDTDVSVSDSQFDFSSTPDETSVATSLRGSGDEYRLPSLASETICRRSQPSISDETGSIAESAGAISQRSNRSTAPWTRPKDFSKKGTYGSKFDLVTNYFEMNKRSNFTLNQYRVDFDPIEDNTKVKKGLMRVHAEKLGAMIFDGHMMYRTDLLNEELEDLVSVTDSGISYKIHIRLVGHVNPDDPMFLQFYNIVMRNCLTLPGMEELCEKVLETIKKELVGQIVMTHYNQKTYRVDDVDSDSTPAGILLGGQGGETKTLSPHLHMNPSARKKKLDDFMARLRNTPEVQNEFKRWGSESIKHPERR